MVFEKTDWDVKTFNVDRDLPIARQKTAAALDAVNPDLSPFRSHGGKLILYHGWNDPAIPAGPEPSSFFRLCEMLIPCSLQGFRRPRSFPEVSSNENS
jgi:hypothetical protein